MTKQMIFLHDELAEPIPATADGEPGFEDDPNDFRLDSHTRDVGRIGIAAARQALADAVKRAAAREQKLAA
jgi:hypothetical protein